ncbi:MAG: hypothetical protein ACFHVJ_04875 [Aestuariibacter sp.]
MIARFTCFIVLLIPSLSWASWYFVSPSGDDNASGLSPDKAHKTINTTLARMYPGDTLYLMPGEYNQTMTTQVSGTAKQPIKVLGSKSAIIRGGTRHLIVEINHSYHRFSGFVVNGKSQDGSQSAHYKNKLIEVSSSDEGVVQKVTLANLDIQQALEECVRIRRNSSHIYLLDNTISHCGLAISQFQGQQSNGEAVYLGSAPEKRKTGEHDFPHNIVIRDNQISGPIGECVDIKEDVHSVEIINNSCAGAWEENSGAINIRGSENLIIGNVVIGTVASGIRIGGDTDKNAINNIIVNNRLIHNTNGGIKIMGWPNLLCGNSSQQAGDVKDVRTKSRYPHIALEHCHD